MINKTQASSATQAGQSWVLSPPRVGFDTLPTEITQQILDDEYILWKASQLSRQWREFCLDELGQRMRRRQGPIAKDIQQGYSLARHAAERVPPTCVNERSHLVERPNWRSSSAIVADESGCIARTAQGQATIDFLHVGPNESKRSFTQTLGRINGLISSKNRTPFKLASVQASWLIERRLALSAAQALLNPSPASAYWVRITRPHVGLNNQETLFSQPAPHWLHVALEAGWLSAETQLDGTETLLDRAMATPSVFLFCRAGQRPYDNTGSSTNCLRSEELLPDVASYLMANSSMAWTVSRLSWASRLLVGPDERQALMVQSMAQSVLTRSGRQDLSNRFHEMSCLRFSNEEFMSHDWPITTPWPVPDSNLFTCAELNLIDSLVKKAAQDNLRGVMRGLLVLGHLGGRPVEQWLGNNPNLRGVAERSTW